MTSIMQYLAHNVLSRLALGVGSPLISHYHLLCVIEVLSLADNYSYARLVIGV
jgi:hypothetical protein